MKYSKLPLIVLFLGAGFGAIAGASDPVETVAPVRDLRFQGYPDAPEFSIVARKKRTRRNKCSRCHAKMEPNPTIRKLADAPHLDGLSHGKGRLWCLQCHDKDERDFLRTTLGEKVTFNEAYMVCGTCHPDRQKDWYYGGHGKRLNNWRGERVVYNCTHCHDAHEPAIAPRAPKPPPPVRAGLQPMPEPAHHSEQAPYGHGRSNENKNGK